MLEYALMKPTYDLVLGLGTACSCTETIRAAGLQFLSLPFDWITPFDHKGDLRRRAACICNGFPGWLRKEDFRCLGDLSTTGRVRYLNENLNFYFLHDFPEDKPVAEAFDDVRAKYERRIARLLKLLQSAKRVLLVRLDLPAFDIQTPPDDCRFARMRLAERFPQTTFDVVLFQPDAGKTFENRAVEELEPGFLRIAFDYHDRRPGMLPHQVDTRRTGEALKAVCAVHDYRTPAERLRERQRVRLEKYRRFGVDTPLQYRLLKLRNAVAGRVLPALAFLRRKKIAHILPLGINCEIAFYLNDVWGFVESSLFAWTSSRHLDRMIRVLSDLGSVLSGEITVTEHSYLWKCERTGLFFHGRLKKRPGMPLPDEQTLQADLADVRARVAHLREKFIRYATDGESTLFVHRISDYDVTTEGLSDRLNALEAALVRLGARNWKLLIVCEKANRRRIPDGPNRLIRTVRRFNPTSNVPAKNQGDPPGWHAIFSEFAPKKILPKAHKFKFE